MTARDTRGWHIGQAALAVDDLDAAVAFYRDTLGVPFIAQPAPTLAFFDCHGVRLMLSSGTGESGAGCTLYFEVPDIDRHYAELQHRGVAFAGPPQGIHSGAASPFYCEVPDIDRHYAELQHRGVAFAGPPQVIHSAADYELRMAFFRDPAGNMLALMAEQGTYVGQ